MVVDGLKVEQNVLDKVTVWAATQLHFRFSELEQKLHRAGIPPDYCQPVTERLIKQWKRDDKVMFRKSQWHWQVGKA